jgi:hypothetical protein
MKPSLKSPNSKRLTLKYGQVLSSFAFNFYLRRYSQGRGRGRRRRRTAPPVCSHSTDSQQTVRLSRKVNE